MSEEQHVEPVSGLPEPIGGLYRKPELVLEEAREASVALKRVIEAKPRKVILNGEQYLEFEDWQTVGRFYGITPRIVRTASIEIGDVRGFEAVAEAVHVATGRVVSSADAMCLTDEDKWRVRPKYEWRQQAGGRRNRVQTGEEPVPLFQLRSMAQTRAAAKAMRNALAWVVVLAGYRPTPAEEIDGAGGGPAHEPEPETASPVDEWADALAGAPDLGALKSRWEALAAKGGAFETFTPEDRELVWCEEDAPPTDEGKPP